MDWKDTNEMIKWGKTPDCLEKCGTCGKIKPLLEFRKPQLYKGKPYWQCKDCAYQSNRKRKLAEYGMSVEEYDGLLLHQSGKCAICRQPPNRRKLAVDHSHMTGKIRGLLCSSCNVLIALAKENPTILSRAIDYLEDGECLTYD